MCWHRNPLIITVIAADLCVRSGVASLSSSQSWQVSSQSSSGTYHFALLRVVCGLHTSCGPLLPLLRGGRGETWQLERRSPRKQCDRFHAEHCHAQQADADAARCTPYVSNVHCSDLNCCLSRIRTARRRWLGPRWRAEVCAARSRLRHRTACSIAQSCNRRNIYHARLRRKH